jgi:tetratricopeptide (TPR) repeat protein
MTPEHSSKRQWQRLAAVTAFLAFWAALLVTIGFPLLLVAVAFVVALVALAAALEGRRTISSLVPRLGAARSVLALAGRSAAGRAERIDWEPLRARGGRGAALAARAGRRSLATGGRAAHSASAALARVGGAAAAVSRSQARAVARELAQLRTQRDARVEAFTLNAEAATLRHQGAHEAALAAGERALELTRQLGDRRAEALTLNGIGLTQARSGDEAGAVDSYEAAIAILTSLGDSHGAGRVLANLGALHLDRGDEDEARARWNDALERLEPDSPEHARTAEQLRLAG